ncbi:hypothetical protein MAM1_0025c02061 [Mucor ambiguus]|uniref:Uncharacterized protein n=1 Tax=Mucor ambiguus TaxID=91626 RepID=A0A0C9MHM4_9FUNG|nr:hypothetical protein MAM1_0025c02061 [Mucor ambiguus]
MNLQNFFSLGSVLDSLMHYWVLAAAAAATVAHLLFWRCSLLVLDSAAYCRSFTVLVLSIAAAAVVLVLFAADVDVYLLSWRLLGVRFCCCCRLFAVLVMLCRINLVLFAAAVIIYLLLLAVLVMLLFLGKFVLVAAAVTTAVY